MLVSCDVWVRASAVLGSQATVHASVTTVHTYGPRLFTRSLDSCIIHAQMSTCAHAGCVHARLVCLACAGATSVAPPSPIAASHMNARARRQPHARPLAHRSSPIPACHCLCAPAVPPPALACSAAHAAMLGEPANREMADVSMVCSRSGSQRAMISRGAAMRMHEWRITQGLRSHVSCVNEVTHLRRELVLGRRVVLGDVRLHVPTDRPTAMEDG